MSSDVAQDLLHKNISHSVFIWLPILYTFQGMWTRYLSFVYLNQ